MNLKRKTLTDKQFGDLDRDDGNVIYLSDIYFKLTEKQCEKLNLGDQGRLHNLLLNSLSPEAKRMIG